MALPSVLEHLLLSFLPGRAIPSLLGVSHTARRLCACLHELDLSGCEELDDMRFASSLVKLWTLDLSDCSERLVDVSPLSSLTSLHMLYLGCGDNVGQYTQLVDVMPLSSLVALKTVHLVGCGLIDVSPLSTLISLTSLDMSWCHQLSNVSPLSSLTSLTSLNLCRIYKLSDGSSMSSLTSLTSLDLSLCFQLSDVSPVDPHLPDQLKFAFVSSAE